MIFICGVHLRLLPFKLLWVGNTHLLSPSLPILVRLLPRDDLGLYLYLCLFHYARIFNNSLWICAQLLCSFLLTVHIQFSEDTCTSSVFPSFLTCMWSMPAYSTPEGYVHKFCVLSFLSHLGFVPAYSIPERYVHKLLVF